MSRKTGAAVLGCGLYTTDGIGCASTPSVNGLRALRFLQALDGAPGMVIGRSLVRDCFKERGAARWFSLLMLVMGIAPIAALFLVPLSF